MQTEKSQCCLQCEGTNSGKLLTCSRCNLAKYCSKECQILNWGLHKPTCSRAVVVKQTPNKGMATFSRRDFEVGEEIFREKPFFTFASFVNGTCKAEAEKIVRAKLEHRFLQLSETQSKIFQTLSDCHSPMKPTPHGVFKTNAIPLGQTTYGHNPQKAGLFALTCRLNHSCKANARYIWREDLGKELVFAMRPIEVGEEITVNYFGGYNTRKKRQAKLQLSFNFTCNCLFCEKDDFHLSDPIFTEVQGLLDNIPNVAFNGNPQVAFRMAERAITLLKQVDFGTPVDLACVHYDAYQMAVAIGDRRKARYHLHRSWELTKLHTGPDSPDAAKYTTKMFF